MKKFLLSVLVSVVFFSCKEDADPVPNVIGEWDLVSIQNGWTGEELIGTEDAYEQTYQFRKDGTFTKTLKVEDVVSKGNGNYSTTPEYNLSSADVKLRVFLEFVGGDDLAGDCNGPESEELILRNNNQLINTWSECDGPSLTYEKK
jgi:opacity protein-like surface antigen